MANGLYSNDYAKNKMTYIIISFVIALPLIIIALLPAYLGVPALIKAWYLIRARNMQKFAREYGFQFKSNTPSYKQFFYQVGWPYALQEDWKTNFIEGTFKGHNIFICDNLFSGPRFLFKPLNENIRRTIVEIDGQEIKGKEYETQFLKFQDGGLTSVWELKRILEKI